MTWVKLEDGFTEHPKVIRAGKLAQSLFIDGLCYSARQLTDGFIPRIVAERFGYGRAFRGAADALITVGLWDSVDGGFQIHDYLEYQQSAASIRAERDAAKERMKRLRSGEHGTNVRPKFAVRSPEVREQDVDTDVDVDKNQKDVLAKANHTTGAKRETKAQLFERRVTEQVTNDWCDEMVAEFSGVAEDEVRSLIKRACNHVNATKYAERPGEGLRIWIHDVWLKKAAREVSTHANNGRSAERNSGAATGDDERFARFRNIPEVGRAHA